MKIAEFLGPPTPNDGDFAIVFFKDAEGMFTCKRKAVRLEFHEYTYNGDEISTSFMSRDEPANLMMRIKCVMSCVLCRLRGDNGWEDEESDEQPSS